MPKTSKAQLTQKPAFQRLKKLFKQPGQKDLLWHYKAGESIYKLYPSDSRTYGEGHIRSLAIALDRKQTNVSKLWAMRSFYERYEQSEVKSLCKPETPGGFVLTWSHMVLLLSLEYDIDRLEYQEECIDGEWSSKELHRRIKEYREPKGKGGRRFRKPKSVEDALRQLIHESRTWDRRYHEVWFPLDDPAIRFVTGKNKTEKVSELAAEAVDILETIQFDLKDALLRLKDLAGASKKKGKRRASKLG